MAKSILLEEFHLSMTVPRGLPDAEYRVIHRTMNGARFRTRLGRAVRDVVRHFPSLRTVRVLVTR